MGSKIDKYHIYTTPFFDFLSTEEAEFVRKHLKRLEFKKKQILFKEDTVSKGVYLLKKGKIKLFQTNSSGKESITNILKKGDHFGYRPLLANDLHPVSAAAIDNVVVSFIPAWAFTEVLNRSTTLAHKLLVDMSKEFTVWVNRASVFSRYTLKQRVALSLLILAKAFENYNSNSKRITISINRDDFAAFVGTAKETLVRMLRVFKDEKLIISKGTKITILKIKALETLIDHI